MRHLIAVLGMLHEINEEVPDSIPATLFSLRSSTELRQLSILQTGARGKLRELAVAAMSHLAYPNLARIENFTERGLNYTGITLEGWADGPNLLVHLFFLVLTLAMGGLPRRGRRLEGLWCLLNIIIIHPMD